MADNEDQSTTDTDQDQGLTPEERQQKAVALGVTLQGLDALERQVSSGVLPTQAAPVAPPMMRQGGVLRPGFDPTIGRGPSAMVGSRPDPDMGWSLRRPPSGVAAAAQPGVSDGVAPVEATTMPVGATPPMLNRGGQTSTGSPIVSAPPAPQGRMYMGPAMTATQEQAFMQSPAGTRQNLMPGWTPEKWDAATQEGITRAPPPETMNAMKRYDAQKTIQEAVKQGMPTSEAIQLYGNGLFPRLETAPKTMNEYQQNETRLRQQQLDQQNKRLDKAPVIKPDTVLAAAIKEERSAFNKVQADLAKTPPTSTNDFRIKLSQDHAKTLKELNDQYQQSKGSSASTPPVQAPAPQGRPVKDKSGKTWIYTGDAKNPKTDIEKSHWVEQ